MELHDFKTVSAGVRPARLAVLLDRTDPWWQDTCQRIIECLSSTWGGKHALLVPTDGTSVDPVFWGLMEAFDPDYICDYQKTGQDWKLALPDEYEARLERELASELASGNTSPAAEVRARIDDELSKAQLPAACATTDLEDQLKRRLAPFFFEQRVISYTFSAGGETAYPLTSVSTIVPYCDHENKLVIASGDAANSPSRPVVQRLSSASWTTKLLIHRELMGLSSQSSLLW